jgi:Rrf2 family protein
MILAWYHYKARVKMKLISRNTDYAIRSMCYIAKQKDRVVSVAELVSALNIPRPFLRKILQALNRRAFLLSYKGKGGGFKLAGSADKTFLLDLMEVFQGPFRLNECTLKKDMCPDKKKCHLKKKIDGIERHVMSELKAITIGSILRGE